MNNISIMGRMTADPKCEYTANSNAVLHFNVAVTRPHAKDTTDFIKCVAWRGTAETIERYFKKGKMIAITGCMTSRSWKGEDNKNHTVMELLVDSFDFCGDKSTAKQPSEHDEPEEDIPEGYEEVNVEEDDIPF